MKNERLGTEFTEAALLFFDQAAVAMKADESVQQAAMGNSEENFRYPAKKKLESVLIDRHQDNARLVNRVIEDGAFGETVVRLLLSRVYEEVREEAG